MPSFEVFTEAVDDYTCICGSRRITLDPEYNYYRARCLCCHATWIIWVMPKVIPAPVRPKAEAVQSQSQSQSRLVNKPSNVFKSMAQRTVESIASHELGGCRKPHKSCADLAQEGLINPEGYCTDFIDYTVPKSRWWL